MKNDVLPVFCLECRTFISNPHVPEDGEEVLRCKCPMEGDPEPVDEEQFAYKGYRYA